MLKFIKGHLQTIDGVEIFPLISFVMFFSFFLLMTYIVFRMKKSEVDHYASLPLESDKKNN
ncbi:MAG: CcoQ/FixQ family Cbb3-type cytochrome c oxidase assembly chaperone [Flavobacteriales bacterium]|nr:CcoQ/FixQ family Cbb3-type cytochrome c oxidase assembly chaperone [Flavobacteriales bacterium]